MKISVPLFAAALLAGSGALAFAAAPQAAPPGQPLPPPGLNDPGVAPAGTSRSPMAPPDVNLPSMRDTGSARDAAPEVTIRQRGDDSVQEYWRAGQLYMVVVTPKNGVPQTYMLDPQGSGWVDTHGQRPLRPVMYKILEWGKSKPAPARASSSGGSR